MRGPSLWKVLDIVFVGLKVVFTRGFFGQNIWWCLPRTEVGVGVGMGAGPKCFQKVPDPG